MSMITTVAPNGTISGPLPNTGSQALALTQSVASTSPAAAALLPQAVLARAPVPNYQEPRSNPKVTLRNPGPSSQLAAQFIAQEPDASDEDRAIFDRPDQQNTPSTPQDTTPPEDDFLAALRTARGDVQQPANSNTPPAQTVANAQPASQNAASNILNFAAQTATITAATKPLVTPDARGLPPILSPIIGRKPGIAQTRGASAYQLATARNDASVISAGVDAIL